MPRENHQLEPGPLGTAEVCSKDAGSLLQLLDLRRTRDSIAHSMGETLAYDVPAPGRASCPPALAVIEAEVSRVEASIQGGLRKVWLGQQQACKTSGPSHGTYPLCGPGGDVWVSAAMTSIQALEHRCAQQACAIEDLRCVQVALGAEANREAEAKLALARELTAAHTVCCCVVHLKSCYEKLILAHGRGRDGVCCRPRGVCWHVRHRAHSQRTDDSAPSKSTVSTLFDGVGAGGGGKAYA